MTVSVFSLIMTLENDFPIEILSKFICSSNTCSPSALPLSSLSLFLMVGFFEINVKQSSFHPCTISLSCEGIIITSNGIRNFHISHCSYFLGPSAQESADSTVQKPQLQIQQEYFNMSINLQTLQLGSLLIMLSIFQQRLIFCICY